MANHLSTIIVKFIMPLLCNVFTIYLSGLGLLFLFCFLPFSPLSAFSLLLSLFVCPLYIYRFLVYRSTCCFRRYMLIYFAVIYFLLYRPYLARCRVNFSTCHHCSSLFRLYLLVFALYGIPTTTLFFMICLCLPLSLYLPVLFARLYSLLFPYPCAPAWLPLRKNMIESQW